MQFVAGGPEIPDSLLLAHEEGRVVFFCGAGISYPAGLPGFKGLVGDIYKLNGTDFTDIEREVFERDQYDATLDLLERRLPGRRLAVRRALAKVLEPKLHLAGATDTHAALLRLGRNREDKLRLVTTNFDRIFHAAAIRTGQPFQGYAAPMLPIPKSSRWNGLVYLHGLLPDGTDDISLNRLVLTSGDFGLAYLTERWAARFVSELFRNFTVCFVGYSINDPVMRYMMDALAADRMQGEITPQAWAFGECNPGFEHKKTIEWEAKGVTPILFNVPLGSYDYSALHRTLHVWANTYRDGVQGKESIVVAHALARPQDSTPQDDFVGRMVWCLTDPSGLPAMQFAEFSPVPSIDWLLECFSRKNFGHTDLSRFGVPPQQNVDDAMRFSLIDRPAPYSHSPPMRLVSGGSIESKWDRVMNQLARWLVRHLGDARLVVWIAEQGGKVDWRLRALIESELNRISLLESDGKTSELDEIRLGASNAIPSPPMRIVWRLILSGRVRSRGIRANLFEWMSCLKREGLTATLRTELRDLLSPKVTLRKPLRWTDSDSADVQEPTRVRQLFDWDLVLEADHVSSTLKEVGGENWNSALPALIGDLQTLLLDALDLLNELGEATYNADRSHWDLPSVSPHWQNRGFHEWATLIELARDSWSATYANDKARASRIAFLWFEFPYPTFKRLAIFAASHDDCVPSERWVDWLLSDQAWWLWAVDLRREALRLLVLQGMTLARNSQGRLEAAILDGPPREMYPGIAEDVFQRGRTHSVWLYLAKLKSSGLVLSEEADMRLAQISAEQPDWKLSASQREEFSHWLSGTGDPDFVEGVNVDLAPRNRAELVTWLAKPVQGNRPFFEDTWRDVCRTRFFHAFLALKDLADDGLWPTERWRDALQVWSEGDAIARAWKFVAPLVFQMPDSILLETDHAVTWWMQAASRCEIPNEQLFLQLCARILRLPIEVGTGMRRIVDGVETVDPVSSAINHPVGHVAQTIINLWFKRGPNDNDGIPPEFSILYTELCDVAVDRFRHGRVVIASHLIAFFRIDRNWTAQHLLPIFDWSNQVEAGAVWEGFLGSPRLYQPLLVAFKSQFLDCANHYSDLGEHRHQYAAFLTYAALLMPDEYSVDDFRLAIGSLPQEGLEDSARALSQAIDGAADQREDYWRNRAAPFWQNVWPKSLGFANQRIAESLARLAIGTRGEFPAALATVQDWLQPIDNSDYIVYLLDNSGLCVQFPADSLRLLGAVITGRNWMPGQLLTCLNAISQADPELISGAAYQRLLQIVRTST